MKMRKRIDKLINLYQEIEQDKTLSDIMNDIIRRGLETYHPDFEEGIG